MFHKKGVSDVITIVLTVMITIAAIAIIWVAVTPLLKERITTASSCYDVNIVIDDSSGYTCYDKTNNISLIQIKRGSSKENITSYKIIVSSEGNSYNYQKDDYLEPNSALVFSLNTTGINSIDRISVIPVVTDGKTEKDCSMVFIDNVKSCALNEQEISELTILQQNERRGSGSENNNLIVNQDPCYGKTIRQQCTDGSWIAGYQKYMPTYYYVNNTSATIIVSSSDLQEGVYNNSKCQTTLSNLWSLPSETDFEVIYDNLYANGLGNFLSGGYPYWTNNGNSFSFANKKSSIEYEHQVPRKYRCMRIAETSNL